RFLVAVGEIIRVDKEEIAHALPGRRSKAGHLAQILHMSKRAVRLAVRQNAIGQAGPDAGQLQKLRTRRRGEIEKNTRILSAGFGGASAAGPDVDTEQCEHDAQKSGRRPLRRSRPRAAHWRGWRRWLGERGLSQRRLREGRQRHWLDRRRHWDIRQRL